jgi:hypothetical protein
MEKLVMKPICSIVVAALLVASPAIAADRLTDRDVKALVERIDDERDRFEDQLDGKVKHNVVRRPSGEVDVERFLDDFQENVSHLKDRLKPDYAASAEVATVLRQGSAIERFMREQPTGLKGESEWNRLASDLKALALVYGADFPLPENAAVRRLGDRELAAAAEEVSHDADKLKQSLDAELKKDPTTASQAREAIVEEAGQLSKDGKGLRDRLNDGEPSSAEADKLLTRAAQLQQFLRNHPLPTSSGVWADMTPKLEVVAGAYKAPWPGPR